MNALPAVELLANNTELVSVKIVELPAVERLKKFVVGSKSFKKFRSLIVAPPAVDVLRKLIVPLPLKIDTLLPAVAPLENTIVPARTEASTAVTTFWVVPELLTMPTPLAPRIVEKESDQSLILYLALNERRRNAEKCCLKVDRG